MELDLHERKLALDLPIRLMAGYKAYGIKDVA